MSFAKLFQQCNSSVYSLRGNVIDCSIELTRGNILYLETGLKSATACFESEIKRGSSARPLFEPTLAPTKHNLLKHTKIPHQGETKHKDTIDTTYSSKLYNVAIEDLELFGEPKLLLPKCVQTIRKRKLVWSELSKVWCSSQNRIRGFVLNCVKGGYAVAIAGHIAFVPKSLLIKSYGQSKFRFFCILNMNPSFGGRLSSPLLRQNIVVKELPSTSGKITKPRPIATKAQWVDASRPSAVGVRRSTSMLRLRRATLKSVLPASGYLSNQGGKRSRRPISSVPEVASVSYAERRTPPKEQN